MRLLLVTAVFAVFVSIWAQEFECDPAQKCDPANCVTNNGGNCHCSGTETPYSREHRPQIVYLTFDDGFTAIAEQNYYSKIFDGTYTNPNGCAIRATHYLTQTSTDYSLVNKYWHMGHEMGAHTTSHRDNVTYWQQASYEDWAEEMVGIRKMIAQFANIPPCDIVGTRAPFLQMGGDKYFKALYENNFLYDCSWPTRAYGYIDAEFGLYPYTLDYESRQDCPIKPCPECSWPGVWVQPMIDLEDEWIGSNPSCPDCGNVCSMLDGCVIPDEPYTAERVFNMIMKNFNRVYLGEADELGTFIEGNKAPWGLFVHAAWFFGRDYNWNGYKMFIEEITNSTKYPDVFVVPVEAGIRYMQSPMPLEVIINQGKKDTTPFGCEAIENQDAPYDSNQCGTGQSCKFAVDIPDQGIHEERYMKICKYKTAEDGSNSLLQCPDENNYPWLGNVCGGIDPCKDCEN